MDRGTWWTTVHEITWSWTLLKQYISHTCSIYFQNSVKIGSDSGDVELRSMSLEGENGGSNSYLDTFELCDIT